MSLVAATWTHLGRCLPTPTSLWPGCGRSNAPICHVAACVFCGDAYSEALQLNFLPRSFSGEYWLTVYLLDLYSRPFTVQNWQALNALISLLVVVLEAWGVAEGFWSGDGHASFPCTIITITCNILHDLMDICRSSTGIRYEILHKIYIDRVRVWPLDGQLEVHYSQAWLHWLSWCERFQCW